MQSPIQPARIPAISRHFTDANGAFDLHNAVYRDVAERMMSRLDLLAIEPTRILDLGCRNGYQFNALEQRFGKAKIIGLDPGRVTEKAPRRWWPKRSTARSCISGDPHELPFEDGEFDLVVSNLLLPWCHDPQKVFAEVFRVLASDAAFLFTSAGPDTLQEYQAVWAQIDSALHVFGLEDMHKIGDALLAVGFDAPVLDREQIQVDYPSIDALQDELRLIGATNVAFGRRAGLMSPNVRNLLKERAGAGRFPVTLELVHGHGWKGSLEPKRNNTSGEYSVSLDSLRQSLQGK